jgi:hypothetical protein
VFQPASAWAQGEEVSSDLAQVGRFDAGKMWTFEYAPGTYFTETYGFDASDAWFERARMAAVRIPGCSASFVSPHGLLATNHHCVRGAVSRVSRPGEALLDNGFFATALDEERRIPRYWADQLIAIDDVSNEVFAALDQTTDPAERDRVRQEVIGDIEVQIKSRHAATGDSIHVQVIGLYHGGRYSAYVFRRFTDIRLVAAAELQMGFFGGDPDNFTYPRYALDFAFLRVYDANGQPFRTNHYFGWGSDGVEEGDVVFVIGNPGATNRLRTIAQLEFQRDVQLPAAIAFLRSRHAALGAYRHALPEEAEALGVRNRMFSLSNSLKASLGRLDALGTPMIMARRRAAEQARAEAIRTDPELAARYGRVLTRIADIQKELRDLAAPYAGFRLLGDARFSSTTLRRALVAHSYVEGRQRGVPGASDAELHAALRQITVHPPDLERRFLAARLADLERSFGPDDEITRLALQDGTPEASAAALLAHSALADADLQAIDTGGLRSDDPALRLAAVIAPRYAAFLDAFERLTTEENELAGDLGRASFAVYGQRNPPDGTRSPRITDGVVQGYEYNGTLAPPYTTFYGLYDRFYAHGGATDWELPERWRSPPPGLDLATPLNFVSTADTYGGNSGSPAVTPDLALVGLNFDRNIEGLSRDYIYLPERGRNIMVDVRAVHAALDHVYDADRIVRELETGRLFRTEQEADVAGH